MGEEQNCRNGPGSINPMRTIHFMMEVQPAHEMSCMSNTGTSQTTSSSLHIIFIIEGEHELFTT
jgi:hypothetical protein